MCMCVCVCVSVENMIQSVMIGLPRWLSGKESPASAGDAGSIPDPG